MAIRHGRQKRQLGKLVSKYIGKLSTTIPTNKNSYEY